MKDLISIFAILIILSLTLSCDRDDEANLPEGATDGLQDCMFEQINENMDGFIDDNERTIMNECRESKITSKSELEDNLIGTWDIIGFGHGWVWSVSQPCSSISITEDNLTFKFSNDFLDTTIISGWEVTEVSTSSGEIVAEFSIEEGLPWFFINTVCSQYMFGDATPSDGNMHLYEKVE